MKKALTLVLALVLCLSVLSVAAFAAGDYYCIAGTMNNWNSDSADRLTDNGDGTYSITFTDLAAGYYEFKFTKNGSWDTCYGGSFPGSGQEADLYSPGSNICFTLEETSDVEIVMNLNTNKFCVTIGGKVDAPAEPIKVHVSVPEGWGDVYVYVWNPEHLGAWSGTKLEGDYVEVPANFEGMVINNGNGTQTWDIKDIDLTKDEVWIVVGEPGADGKYSYALFYTEPDDGTEVPTVHNITVHISAPADWTEVYAYVWNPEQLGTWAGTKVENGVIEVPAQFEGMVISNGNGTQTWDIKDIDLTKEEVWIAIGDVDEYGKYSYTLSYDGSFADLPQTGDAIVPVIVVMMAAAACGALLLNKKKYF